MEIELLKTVKVDVKFLEVSAGVRYWDDSTINGGFDAEDGKMPLRAGDRWAPVIDLETGTIQNWPSGTTAGIHYKVCDDGEYWLQGADGKRVAKYKSDYVPGEYLCQNDSGYGDYIIMEIGADGVIANWSVPEHNRENWEAL